MGTLATNLIDFATAPGAFERSEFYGLDVGRFLSAKQRSDRGQFFTPAAVARFMAGLSQPPNVETIRLLDPGAGVGSLSAAWVEEVLSRDELPRSIELTVCESDPRLCYYPATRRSTQPTCGPSLIPIAMRWSESAD